MRELSEKQRTELKQLIELSKLLVGSFEEVGDRLGYSGAHIIVILKEEDPSKIRPGFLRMFRSLVSEEIQFLARSGDLLKKITGKSKNHEPATEEIVRRVIREMKA